MLFRILLIAAAALLHSAPTSRADVGTINDAAALEELLVPFNDLLPPLESDGEQSIATTTTTTTTTSRITKRTTTPSIAIKTTPLTTTTTSTTARTTPAAQFNKPTKKSYYQQQKDLHKVDENVGVQTKLQDLHEQGQQQQQQQANDIQLLSLDLLPPFESVDETAQPQQQQQQQQQSSNQQSVKLALPKTKVSAVAQSKTSKQNVAKQQDYKQQDQKQHVAIKPTQQAAVLRQQQTQQQHVDSLPVELLQQYADYFNKQTTKRPPRGPLPTITPFPNRLK